METGSHTGTGSTTHTTTRGERSISVRGKGRDESQGIDINRQSKDSRV